MKKKSLFALMLSSCCDPYPYKSTILFGYKNTSTTNLELIRSNNFGINETPIIFA